MIKQIFIFACFFLLSSCISFGPEEDNSNEAYLWNEENNYWPAIFQVNNYEYDILNQTYKNIAYGSAVYIWNNTVLTNAHVLEKSYNDDYSWFYEVCETKDFRQSPKCFAVWELIYYDTDRDLALLRLDSRPGNRNIIPFSDIPPKIWDIVTTYGYPSHWWVTITSSKWQISWYEEGYYKIDANLDFWSSGGAGLNDKWELIWITTAIYDGVSSLGYMIPIIDINNFIQKKWDIEYFSDLDNQAIIAFKWYLNKYNTIIKEKSIDAKYVRIDDIWKYNYEIIDTYIDNMNKFEGYTLISESKNTVMYVDQNIFWSDTQNAFNTYIDVRTSLALSSKNKSMKETYVDIKGEKYFFKYEISDLTGSVYMFFKNKDYVSFEVYGHKDYPDELKNAFDLISSSTFKSGLNTTDGFSIEGMTLKLDDTWVYQKYLSYGTVGGFKWYKLYSDDAKNFLYFLWNSVYYLDGLTLDKKTYLDIYVKELEKKNTVYRALENKNGDIFLYHSYRDTGHTKYHFKIIRSSEEHLHEYTIDFRHVGFSERVSNDILDFFNSMKFEGKSLFARKDFDETSVKVEKLSEYAHNFNNEAHKEKVVDLDKFVNTNQENFYKFLQSLFEE